MGNNFIYEQPSAKLGCLFTAGTGEGKASDVFKTLDTDKFIHQPLSHIEGFAMAVFIAVFHDLLIVVNNHGIYRNGPDVKTKMILWIIGLDRIIIAILHSE